MIRQAVAAAAAIAITAACQTEVDHTNPTSGDLTVFAAASLQPAFDETAKLLQSLHITFNYAGTQTLTSQLTQGAQADVFASADTAHMSSLQSAGLISGTPQVFAHNRLEIAVQRGNPKRIHSLSDLARGGLVVVLADPSVPAGKYAQQAMQKAGISVRPASLELQVTAVVNKVALGEADAGVVYVSDITSSGKVDGIPIQDSQNVVANYPIALLASSRHQAQAMRFIDFVLSPPGQTVLRTAGFEAR